jgi:CheY-like chemotaxis protein
VTAGLPPGAAILLVEDDVATRGEVATFLRGHGFRVDEAGDGALAWDRWTAHRPWSCSTWDFPTSTGRS